MTERCPALGMDLGSSQTHAATEGTNGLQTIMLADNSGQPSVAFWDESAGEYLVGDQAINAQANDPDCFVEDIKPFVGLRDQQGNPHILLPRAGDKGRIPFILKAFFALVMTSAERFLGKETPAIIVGHPDEASQAARDDYKSGAELAGFKLVHFIPEAQANVLYADSVVPCSPGTTGALVDGGNSTCNVVIFEKTPNAIRTLGVATSKLCGGVEFTAALMKVIRERFPDQEMDQSLLFRESERVKKALSDMEKATAMPGRKLKAEITRAMAEKAWAQYRKECQKTIEEALSAAGLGKEKIQHLILAGGNNNIPSNRVAVCEFFRMDDSRLPHPEMGVAYGAVLSAQQQYATKGVIAVGGIGEEEHVLPVSTKLERIASRDISIELKDLSTQRQILEALIPRGERIPKQFSKSFSIDRDTARGTGSVAIILRHPQAGKDTPESAPLLARYVAENLAASEETKERIRLEIDVAEDEQISVKVFDNVDQQSKGSFQVDAPKGAQK